METVFVLSETQKEKLGLLFPGVAYIVMPEDPRNDPVARIVDGNRTTHLEITLAEAFRL